MSDPRDPGSDPVPLTTVYGGGGLLGIGYNLGVVEALADRGFALAGVPALGTSAGSWAAAGMALGIRFHEAIDLIGPRIPRIPDPRPGHLQAVASELFGRETRCPTVRVVACALPDFHRTVLSGADFPIADLVAASSAVPALLAPQRVGEARYVDGGVRSMASIDLAPPAAHLLVVLPMAGPMFGPFGWFVERGSRRELAAWQRRNPDARVTMVRPTREIRAVVHRPDQLFDTDRAEWAYELAYEQGSELVFDGLPDGEGLRLAG